MCLIVFAHQHFSGYKLVLLSNRDEYHERAATPAGFWPSYPKIFGGQDEVAGGSWLSVDTSGRLAAITNVRKQPFNTTAELSRGLLVSDFLKQSLSAADFINELKKNDAQYALFNLLLSDKSGLWHYSNDTHKIHQINKGVHGLSNASLNTPWPKLRDAVSALEHAESAIDVSALLNIMHSEVRPSDSKLPSTGATLELERLLSAVFIKNDAYGTRCSTVITIDYENTLKFHEVSFDAKGKALTEVSQCIDIL